MGKRFIDFLKKLTYWFSIQSKFHYLSKQKKETVGMRQPLFKRIKFESNPTTPIFSTM